MPSLSSLPSLSAWWPVPLFSWQACVAAAVAGVLLDQWLGEPRRWHPLVGFGRLALVLRGAIAAFLEPLLAECRDALETPARGGTPFGRGGRGCADEALVCLGMLAEAFGARLAQCAGAAPLVPARSSCRQRAGLLPKTPDRPMPPASPAKRAVLRWETWGAVQPHSACSRRFQ